MPVRVSVVMPTEQTPPSPGNRLATAALVLAAFGVVMICVPLSLLALPLALVARGKAMGAGQQAPRRALVAVAVALLGLASSSAAYVTLYREGTRIRMRAAAIEQRVADRISAPTIDLDTTCTLAEAALVRSGQRADKLRCALVATSEDRIVVDATRPWSDHEKTTRICLRRGGKWFVIGLSEHCSTAPLSPAVTGLPEEAQDEKWRNEEANRLVQDEIDFASRLVARLRERPRVAPLTCEMAKSPGKAALLTIDGSVLNGGARRVDWEFLTSKELQPLLDEKASAKERAEVLRESRGAAIAIVWPGKLVAPELVRTTGESGKGENGFLSGHFDGEIILVDVPSGEVRCSVALAFRNRNEASFISLSSADKTRRASYARDALIHDLREQYLLNLGTALAKHGAPVAPRLDGSGRAYAVEWQ